MAGSVSNPAAPGRLISRQLGRRAGRSAALCPAHTGSDAAPVPSARVGGILLHGGLLTRAPAPQRKWL